jgi:Flp pilus assembly protein TadG
MFTCRRLRVDDGAAQIVEFALSLPLLVLFIVGIYDFSGALALKQKLTNAAREGARVAAAGPANDLTGFAGSMPASVNDTFQVVDNYLISEKINDCGLSTSPPAPSGTFTWTFNNQINGCLSPGITLTVNRGYYFGEPGTAQASVSCASTALTNSQTAIVGTCVSLQYPYQWRFGGVSGLFGGSFLGPTTITTSAVEFNEN